MEPTMVCLQMDAVRALRFSLAALSVGVRVRQGEAESGEPLYALCGLTAAQLPPAPAVPAPPAADGDEEMLLFAFVPDALLERLLRALRETGLPLVRLKAVLTPANCRWTCAQLRAALRAEAGAMET